MGLRELRELGRGSFGRVFLAHDDVLGIEVAVKELIRPDAEFERFQREARLLAEQVANDYVVTILRSELDGSNPRIVLEYCDGGSLRQWVAQASWQQAATMLLHAANGLLGIHSAGGFHRDIKPENLLLGRVPGVDGYVVKVADFGLARVPATVSPPMTRGAGGTAGYIAPEVYASGAQFSSAADIYSLGIVGIELLTGQRAAVPIDPTVAPIELRTLLVRMTSPWAPLRPTAADLIVALGEIVGAQAPPQKAPADPPPRAAPRPQPAPPPPPAPPRAPATADKNAGLGWLFLIGGLAAAAAIAAGSKDDWDDSVGRRRGRDGRFKKS